LEEFFEFIALTFLVVEPEARSAFDFWGIFFHEFGRFERLGCPELRGRSTTLPPSDIREELCSRSAVISVRLADCGPGRFAEARTIATAAAAGCIDAPYMT
jgi:hypothetical protein